MELAMFRGYCALERKWRGFSWKRESCYRICEGPRRWNIDPECTLSVFAFLRFIQTFHQNIRQSFTAEAAARHRRPSRPVIAWITYVRVEAEWHEAAITSPYHQVANDALPLTKEFSPYSETPAIISL